MLFFQIKHKIMKQTRFDFIKGIHPIRRRKIPKVYLQILYICKGAEVVNVEGGAARTGVVFPRALLSIEV